MKNLSKIGLAALAGLAFLFAKKSKKVSGVGAVDSDAVREISLWFDNTRELHERYTVPMAKNLVKKMKKGIQPDLMMLANSSVVDNAVRDSLRDYGKSFGSFPVSAETRKAMKKEIADSILAYAQDEYDYELNN